MRKRLSILISVFILSIVSISSAEFSYKYPGHFGVGIVNHKETGVPGQIRPSSNIPERKAGLRSIIVEQLEGQPTYQNKPLLRTELKIRPQPVGSEQWYAISYYVPDMPEWDKAVGTWNLIFQLHANPDPGEPWRHPVVSMGLRVKDGVEQYFIERAWSRKKINISRQDIDIETKWMGEALGRNRWHDFIIHAKWHADDRGVLEIWKDGVKVINLQNTPVCFNDDPSPGIYLKAGLYRYAKTLSPLSLYIGYLRQESGSGKFNGILNDMGAKPGQGQSPAPLPEPKPTPTPQPIPEPAPIDNEGFFPYDGPQLFIKRK